MKRLTLNLTATFLVEHEGEDTTTVSLAQQDVIMGALRDLPGLEAIGFGRTELAAVRAGTCSVGDHVFYVDRWFPDDRPVPGICRDHAYTGAIEHAEQEHRPFFEEVERLTGLKGHIWQSGGMTMTIVVPLPKPPGPWPPADTAAELDFDTTEWLGLDGSGRDLNPRFPYTWDRLTEDERERLTDVYPCYMGLKEGQDDGRWVGSLSYYATAEQGEDGVGDDLLPYPYEPMTPQQWAAKLATHYTEITEAS